MFYFNSKELQSEIEVLCMITCVLGYSLFETLLVEEGDVFISV